jgi:hypothetical protein
VPIAHVLTNFDCGHHAEIDVSIDDDIVVPPTVRGLGRCPDCMSEDRLIAISGVAPRSAGRELVLDSILMMPVEG